MRLIPGSLVRWKDRIWDVVDLDLETAWLRLHGGKLLRKAPPSQLAPAQIRLPDLPLALIERDRWESAVQVADALRPLLYLKSGLRSVAEVDAAAAKLGKSRASVYAYLKRWDSSRRISAFLRKARSDKGKKKLDEAIHRMIEEGIKKYYLVAERPDYQAAFEQICTDCRIAGLDQPSFGTVKNTIQLLKPKLVAKSRLGRKLADERFEPIKGSFPGADFPLAAVQIDHTPADVTLVDEIDRKPIGRAHLTIAIDVCTRMICGFVVSLEHPSAMLCALVLTHSILPKDDWLRKHDLDGAKWPIWGIPRKVFCDNAKEFRGTALSRGCQERDIVLENRPKGLPRFGGTVERSFRSFMRAVHSIKGSTFSNPQDRLEYDSEGRAILTHKELERWFAIFIAYRYHNKGHKGIDYYPPINLYNKFILGDQDRPGMGLPEPIDDHRRLLLDFLPYELRPVTREGIVLNYIKYWHESLRAWIGSVSLEDRKNSRKFVCVYDPRDLSFIYFFDPELKEYLSIPYRDRSRPEVSKWEVDKVKKEIAKDPDRQSNQDEIFKGIVLMRELEEEAEVKTNAQRRMRARKEDWKESGEVLRGTSKSAKEQKVFAQTSDSNSDEGLDDEIVPYAVHDSHLMKR